MGTKLHYVLSMAMLLSVISITAQNTLFKKIEAIKNPEHLSKFHVDKNKVHFFELELNTFKNNASKAILRGSKKQENKTVITIPVTNGEMEQFVIYEAPVFSQGLSKKYPDIKSYVGFSKSGGKLRMSISPQGLQTMISYAGKATIFMQPVAKNSKQYVLYSKKDKDKSSSKFECKTIDDLGAKFNTTTSKVMVDEGGANNQTLQKFRIAVSTTSEYTAYHDDGIPENGDAIADALAAINVTLSRVNEVFEADMAVTFELVDATQLIYNDAANDPYSDPFDLDDWNVQLQNTLTNEIGNSAYDIGHLFGDSGGGGNAGCIGCVCVDDTISPFDQNKGSGYTSPANAIPETDTFDIDYVAHEIGHQMGANHTWAFSTEGTGVNSEPGSGSTIMGYAGITGPDDVQTNSDDYFHYHSIKQILDNLGTKTCQTTETITNNPPSANAGSDYNIPPGTAYVLKGAAADANSGDNLTYCWEQIDSGVSDFLNFGPDLVSGSTNRSLPPSSSPDRFIPRFSSVIAGNTTQTNPTLGSDWETVSGVARTLNWALTVRDRDPSNASGGQTSYDTMVITVEDVEPFTVTNPLHWTQGDNVTINWNEGQTNNGTINCQNVNILLSTDGGLSFPNTIATNTPNDGVHNYTVPSIPDTSNARILIEAADNIFYDVSDFNFSISSVPDFYITNVVQNNVTCNAVSATFNFDYTPVNGFSETTTFSATGNPGGSSISFSPSSLNTAGNVSMTISNLNSTPEGDYPMIVTGTSTSITKNKNINFAFYNSRCNSFGNTLYATSTTLVQFNTINNISGKPSGYNDNTSITTTINRESSYDLTINVNTDGDFSTNTYVWIDWNQDCKFNTTDEQYNLGDASNVSDGITSNSPLTITIPSTALLDNTIMRVSTKYADDGLPFACEQDFDGEVEDYTINISVTTLDIDEFDFDNFNVYPNPSKGKFTIKLNSGLASNINVDVFDLRGRVIYKNTFKNIGDFNETITLNNVQSGIYILNVSNGLRRSTKKILVE